MGAKDNPFSRIVAEKAEHKKADEVEEAAAGVRARDDELKQADGDGASGRRDVPSAVTDNADAERVGEDHGLASLQVESAKDRVGDTQPADDASSDVDTAPASPEQRIAGRTGIGGHVGGMTPRDALDAASGDDNTDVSGLLEDDPRAFAQAAKEERNPLNDPVFAAGMALVDEQANAGASKYSVAQGSDDLARAISEVYGEPAKNPDAGKSTNVELVHKGSAGKTNQDAAYWDDDKGEVVYPEQVTEAGKEQAEKGQTTTRQHNKDADDDTQSSGTGIFGAIGEYFAEREYQKEWGETERKAAELQAARKPGGGVGTPKDPDDPGGPPTEAEIAFRLATQQALGIRRIPGDIDPEEGDGTPRTGGAVDEDQAARFMFIRSRESLEQPDPDSARRSPPAGQREGSPGFGGARQGGDVDPLEGSAFTGGQRTEDPRDVDFGVGSQPLVGFDRGDDEDDDDDDAKRSSRTSSSSDDEE